MTRIAVYMTGGIAVYKAVQVVRDLEKNGHEVRVVMTKNAEHFVTSNTLAALTKYPVLDDLWSKENEASIPHVHLARWSELALVVPATANFIAKMANGLADDAASTTILATAAPKMIVPAMNDQMWNNPATRHNVLFLKENGVKIMDPAVGMLAESYAAKGRMPEPADVVDWVEKYLNQKNSLQGKIFVITAGGTEESIDPVRFIGNRSSGKMGFALAENAARLGATVKLIYGNVTANPPQNKNIKMYHATSSEDMFEQVKSEFKKSDVLIMAAAVADWRMPKVADHKLKNQIGQETLNLTLIKTKDILQEVAHHKKHNQLVIGFAAETNDLLENAEKKLKKKGADMIVANDVSHNVFGNDYDQVTLLTQDGHIDKWPRMSKQEIAYGLIEKIARELK
ncbi:bifunctional phosphopantothenoylcysteine decarboxylase/phosphopantothenate--cysteine ligase CoaBC [Lactobacillus acidophilus]|uniref:bifunctional phosphopantothenoylcysteine decarboxylase/phosphopantothenate--cysteine ligase CoaBC n=1 Tax=Lactobacillus acidophilus TaxID=1579 RepID=UPI001F0A08F7|nr:bifunctional phosphopantothenoylcysteine decarboxylase/phosphopantothenate--cysteine ligase CoaBC [Lactobacillus acidophilus]MBN3488599.1 bifunctional phosphopantothenoylcysteine decarboxylase/phosphopantothenate--cysteine ligase CoaBC [Lactobacillus acidophilus]